MKKVNMIGAAMVAAAMTFTGCDKATPSPSDAAPVQDEAVLTVNGTSLMRSQLNADVEAAMAAQGVNIPDEYKEQARKQLSNQIAEAFVIENVLLKAAQEKGYSVTPEELKEREADLLKSLAEAPDAPKTFEEAIEKSPLGRERALAEFRNGAIITKMIKAEVVDKISEDYEARAKEIISRIEAANAANSVDFEAALAKIQGFKATLDATPDAERSAKFAELAKENSDCPSSAKGGDLGEFTKGKMVPEFETVAFAQEVGQISDPVKTRFGYHLILTTAKEAAVEATDDKPYQPERVRASHILVKAQEPQEVPTVEEVVKVIKGRNEQMKVGEYIRDIVRTAQITAAADFSQFVPPPEEPEEAVAPVVSAPAPVPAPEKPEEPKDAPAPETVEPPPAEVPAPAAETATVAEAAEAIDEAVKAVEAVQAPAVEPATQTAVEAVEEATKEAFEAAKATVEEVEENASGVVETPAK